MSVLRVDQGEKRPSTDKIRLFLLRCGWLSPTSTLRTSLVKKSTNLQAFKCFTTAFNIYNSLKCFSTAFNSLRTKDSLRKIQKNAFFP
jgi:hypothetical protein